MLVGGVVLPALVLFDRDCAGYDPPSPSVRNGFRPSRVVQILAVFFMSRALQTWNSSVLDAAGKPHIGMILNACVLIALPPSIWFGSAYGVEGVAVACVLAALICGEIPSFLLTTRELSLKPLHVLGRLREIAISSATAGIAVKCSCARLCRGGPSDSSLAWRSRLLSGPSSTYPFCS